MAELPDYVRERVEAITSVLMLEHPGDEQLAAAAGYCEELLRADRENAGAIFLIATVYLKAGKHGLAENLYMRALQLAPDMPEIYNNLGSIYQLEGRTAEALEAFSKTQELDPDNNEALGNLASVYVNNHTPDKAIELADRLLEREPDNNDAIWNRGLAYLEKGMWDEGWKAYRHGLNLRGTASGVRKYRDYGGLPYWDGTPDQTVIVYGEQGVGDEILGYSMLPDLIAHGVRPILETHPRLVNIARNSFDEAFPIYGTRKGEESEITWPKWHNADARIPIIGLAEYFRGGNMADWPERKPYLKPDIANKERIRRQFDERPVVGISWAGGTLPTRADLRSLSMSQIHPLLAEFQDRINWVSLQYDPAEQMGFYGPLVAGFTKDTGVNLAHDSTLINDLDICYPALLPACDLVISVNTSVVHACGAFGVPCWALTPWRAAWRYQLEGNHMPWYGGHVEVMRQDETESWTPVLNRVKQYLSDWLWELDQC